MSSGPTTTNNGMIQRREERPEAGLAKLLEQLEPQMRRAIPAHMKADRMARVALTALRTVPKLSQCTPASFAACIMTLSQIGLEPCTPLGHAYLIPRRNNKANTTECTLIIGYQGFIDLARRSGDLAAIWATPVYSGDRFVVRYGLAPTIEHEPDLAKPRTRETLTHVYAVARLKSSEEPIFVVLTKAEIEGYRKRGASARTTTPWDTDYEAMALKTAIRRLFRWLPKSIEVASAIEVEDRTPSLSVVSDSVREAVEGQGYALPDDTETEVLDVAEVPDAVPAGEGQS